MACSVVQSNERGIFGFAFLREAIDAEEGPFGKLYDVPHGMMPPIVDQADAHREAQRPAPSGEGYQGRDRRRGVARLV